MKQRVFIGIFVNEEIRQRIVLFANTSKIEAKWIDPKRFHITLAPPLYLEEEEIKNLINKLRKVEAGPGKIQFYRISVEPPKRNDMLWVVGESKGLEELRLEIYKAIGVISNRKFVPHVSIAKLNKKFELSKEIDWFMPYDSFSVIKSELKPEGAEYSEIEKICL